MRPPEHQPPLPSDKSFGLTFAVIFAILAGIMAWKTSQRWPYVLVVSVLFLASALVRPQSLHILNVGWMRFAELLHRVVSPLIMGVIYFGLLTPVALFMRARGRDDLHRKLEPNLQSYWVKRDPPGPDESSFPLQY